MTIAPDGLFQYGGIPVGNLWGSPWSKAYFVDAVDGKSGNYGERPDDALTTIQAALDKCARGDVVYIRPQEYKLGRGFERYSEDVSLTMTKASTASYPVCGPSDVHLIGCTNSRNPEFGVRWKPATATALTSAWPSLHVENIGFYAEDLTAISLLSNGVTDTQRGIDGTTIVNCTIKGGGMTAADGGTGLTLYKVRFTPKYDGTVAAFAYTCNAAPGRLLTIQECEFMDGNGTAASDQSITLTGAITEVLIRDCFFGQVPTGNAYVVAGASVEGIIANCFFAATDATTTGIEQGGMFTVACHDVTGSNIL
jgi:hypothetical protein